MNLTTQLWENYFLYMNLTSHFKHDYSQGKPQEKSPQKHKDTKFLSLVFLSASVTWWQKEKIDIKENGLLKRLIYCNKIILGFYENFSIRELNFRENEQILQTAGH